MEDEFEFAKINGIDFQRRTPARQQLPTFNQVPDTHAHTAWRNRDRPQAVFRLPRDFGVEEQRRASQIEQTCLQLTTCRLARRWIGASEVLFKNFPYLKEVAQEEGVHMMFKNHSKDQHSKEHRSRQSGSGGLEIEIWGDPERCQLAKAKIRGWIQDVTGDDPVRKQRWPKLLSMTEQERSRREYDLGQEVHIRSFCQAPSEDVNMSCLATFEWPTDAILGGPQRHLGQQFEALDAVRMEEQCWITCDASTSTFTVLGSQSISSVKNTLIRLRGIYMQIAAHHIEEQKFYMLAPPTAKTKKEIELVSHERESDTGDMKVVAVGYGKSISVGDAWTCAAIEKENKKHHSRIKTAVLSSLASLRYYRGQVDMRLCFGKFFLTRYYNENKLPTRILSRGGFAFMMGEEGGEGQLVEDLTSSIGGREDDTRYRSFLSAHLLQPIVSDHGGEEQSILSVAFLFKDKEGHVQLRTEYAPDNNGHLDRIIYGWHRMGRDDGTPKEILEAITMDVDKDLAWTFRVVASYAVNEDRDPSLTRFGDGVKALDKRASLDRERSPVKTLHPEMRVTFKPEISLRLLSIEQKEIFRYRFSSSDHTCDISRSKTFKVLDPGSVMKPPRVTLETDDSTWNVAITSDGWRKCLAQNADLRSGDCVMWTADAPTFFPEEAGKDGFECLLERVAQLESVIQGNGDGDNGNKMC